MLSGRLIAASATNELSTAVSLHPENARYFEFRGKPLALICATEHYGSVINRRFDFERYLTDHASRKHTLTRLFLLFRELQSPNNPYSPCKPESPDFISPWPRTGPGRALDGEPKYDLSMWNGEYFDRLHAFFSRASDLGIVVEATLLSNTYGPHIYALNPLHPDNNLQGIGTTDWRQYNTMVDSALWDMQKGFIRKVVAELNRYDNFYFEVCNEPGSWDENGPVPIDEWQMEILRIIRAEEAGMPTQHLVAGAQAFVFSPWRQDNDAAFESGFDLVNVHPLPNTVIGGKPYELGEFMSGQLKLEGLKEFCLAASNLPKPCVQDEDNIASCYRDYVGWTIHRKRAWTTVMSGSHYDVIDFSITVHAEAGTSESQAAIRSWIGYLSEFAHSMDLPCTRPLGDWLTHRPPHVVESTLAVPGVDYAVYLADDRERENPDSGAIISGMVHFSLREGAYVVRMYSPTTGVYSPAVHISGGAQELELPEFKHDIVMRISRTGD